MVVRCVKCGLKLYTTMRREKFCPNHGVIAENQEWEDIKEEKEENDD